MIDNPYMHVHKIVSSTYHCILRAWPLDSNAYGIELKWFLYLSLICWSCWKFVLDSYAYVIEQK